MRLFYKFLLAFLGIALGPLVLVGWRLLGEMETSLRATSLRLQQGLADRAAENVRVYLDDARSVLTLAHKNPGVLSRDSRAVRETFEIVLNNYPMFMDLRLLDLDGREVGGLGRFL